MRVDLKSRARPTVAPSRRMRFRSLSLSDSTHDRLLELARRCQSSVSAVAEAILDEGLARLGIAGRDEEGGAP